MSLALSLDYQFKTTIEKAWTALTDNLHLEQTGFSNVHGLEGARYGWGEWFGGFEQALDQ